MHLLAEILYYTTISSNISDLFASQNMYPDSFVSWTRNSIFAISLPATISSTRINRSHCISLRQRNLRAKSQTRNGEANQRSVTIESTTSRAEGTKEGGCVFGTQPRAIRQELEPSEKLPDGD